MHISNTKDTSSSSKPGNMFLSFLRYPLDSTAEHFVDDTMSIILPCSFRTTSLKSDQDKKISAFHLPSPGTHYLLLQQN